MLNRAAMVTDGVDPNRAVAWLRELHELTGNERGAQREAWTPTWQMARDWLARQLSRLPVSVEYDEAGNQWATLPGDSARTLIIGGHLDSVLDGGWLDGSLNVMAGLEVLDHMGRMPARPITVRLVNWADEEGRFGHSLFGSSAASGTMRVDAVRDLKDRTGLRLEAVLADYGVELDRIERCREQLRNAVAYLELHIEQGPVLESNGLPLGVVLGTKGVKRHLVRFRGQSAHSGSTPMSSRKDALLAGARFALAVRDQATRAGEYAVGTVGRVQVRPGIETAVPGFCEVTLDQRDVSLSQLNRLVDDAREMAHAIASQDGVKVDVIPTYEVEPVSFDPELIEVCAAAVGDVGCADFRLPSGPLHDATEMARGGIPTAMIFVQSLRGLSHTPDEDTTPEHLHLAIRALDRAVSRSIQVLATP
jgi:N-carbamoyl-L-amino-acid hydrolase